MYTPFKIDLSSIAKTPLPPRQKLLISRQLQSTSLKKKKKNSSYARILSRALFPLRALKMHLTDPRRASLPSIKIHYRQFSI